MATSKFKAEGNPVMDKHPIQREVEILLSLHATETGDKVLASLLITFAEFTFLPS